MTSRRYRCSSLPRILACPASSVEPEAPYDPQHAWTVEGRAGHADIAATLLGEQEQPQEEMSADAIDWLIKTLAPLVVSCRLQIEQHLDSPRFPGTPDVRVAVDCMEYDGVVVDWKLGHVIRDCRAQLLGYADLCRDNYGWEYVKAYAYYPRLKRAIEYDFTPLDMDQLHADIAEAESNPDRYNPGEACTCCPRQLECKARRAMMRAAVVSFGGHCAESSDSDLARLYPVAQQVRKALAEYDKALKTALRQGNLEADGKALCLHYERREKIIPAKARPICEKWIGADAWQDVTSVSKTALTKAVKAASAKGAKKQAEQEFLAELRAADAVEVSTIEKIKEG
jgi:hypothetical protein